MFFSAKEIIGIEIGSAWLKATVLGLKKADQTVYVRDYAMVPAEAEGRTLDQNLKRMLRKLRTRTRNCAVSINSADTRVKVFADERARNVAEMRSAIRMNPASVFLEPLPNYHFDCDKASTRKSGNTSSYVACAISAEGLKSMEQMLDDAGYQLTLLQASPVAIFNAFVVSHPELAREAFLLVDFGQHRSTIIGGSAGTLRMVRTIEFGWNHTIQALPANPVVTGRTDSTGQGNGFVDQGDPEMMYEVLQPLSYELQRTIAFLCGDNFRITQLHTSGALSTQLLVAETLRANLDLVVAQWNPFRKAAAKTKALANFELLNDLCRLPAAAGAALQSLL